MSKPDQIIRVLIADDHPAMRVGIRAILEEAPDIEVVGEAQDGAEAKWMVAALRPDVLLLDLVMPGLRPFEVEEWVRTNCPETTVIVLTGHDRDCFLAQAVEAGVVGFLTKEEDAHRLANAVQCAARGEVLITGGQLARAYRWRKEVGERWERLTQREREVLRSLARGLDNKGFAETLRITPKTAECHVTRILRKLGVRTRQEAIAWAYTHYNDLQTTNTGYGDGSVAAYQFVFSRNQEAVCGCSRHSTYLRKDRPQLPNWNSFVRLRHRSSHHHRERIRQGDGFRYV